MVVGIVIILTVILLPNIIRSKMGTNEKAAIAACKTIANGLSLYMLNNDEFPDTLSEITTPLQNPPYIDENVAYAISISTAHNGYWFEYAEKASEDGFTLRAHPKSPVTGKRYFFVDESGIIRYATDSSVNATSPSV